MYAQERGNPTNASLTIGGAGGAGQQSTEPSVISAHRRTVKATHYARDVRNKLMEIAGRLDGGPSAVVESPTTQKPQEGLVNHMHGEHDELREVLSDISALAGRIDRALGQS